MSYEHPTYEELVRDTLLWMIMDLSEDCYCAQWLINLEFILWDKMMTGKTDFGFGMEESDLIRLKSLSELAGGWWTWPQGEEQPRFVNTEEWTTIYATHAAGPEA
jgi:hypothetical protein